MTTQQLNEEINFDLQDNIKIHYEPKDVTDEGLQPFKVVPKTNTNKIFYAGVVLASLEESEMVTKMNEQYCEWYRSGGRNQVRKYFNDEKKH